MKECSTSGIRANSEKSSFRKVSTMSRKGHVRNIISEVIREADYHVKVTTDTVVRGISLEDRIGHELKHFHLSRGIRKVKGPSIAFLG